MSEHRMLCPTNWDEACDGYCKDLPYRSCLECGRVYERLEDLIAAFKAHGLDIRRRTRRERPAAFCPECLHDF